MALLLAGNATSARAETNGGITVNCTVEESDETVEMLIGTGRDSGINAYDLDVVYDPAEVKCRNAEAVGKETRAFAYDAHEDSGVLRIVCLTTESITEEGTFLRITWSRVSSGAGLYIPTLKVRDLAAEDGSDILYEITYTDASGAELAPGLQKRAGAEDEDAGGDLKAGMSGSNTDVGEDTGGDLKTGMSGSDTDAADASDTADAEDGHAASEVPPADDVQTANDEIIEEDRDGGESANAGTDKADDVSGSDGSNVSEEQKGISAETNVDESDSDKSGSGESADHIPDEESISDTDTFSDPVPAPGKSVRESAGETLKGKESDVGASGEPEKGAFIVALAAGLILAGAFYYKKKKL